MNGLHRAVSGSLLSLAAACAGTAERRAAACSAIAEEYAAALASAVVCDPAASAACAAQRPIADRTEATRLCWNGNQGYVANPAALDDLLVTYGRAGCDVGSCAGPALHAVTSR